MPKTWIKSSVLLLGMSLGGAALLAQQAAMPALEAATPNAATETAKPQLTAEQKKQLSELRANAHDQAAIIRHDQALTDEQKQVKLKALRASTHEQMKSVLTPEQQKAFADRHRAGRARFAEKLGLSPEQQTKMKDLFTANHQQREAALKNAALSNEQKQAQLSQIRQSSNAQLATILTPEQLEKFHQMRRMHHHGKLG